MLKYLPCFQPTVFIQRVAAALGDQDTVVNIHIDHALIQMLGVR